MTFSRQENFMKFYISRCDYEKHVICVVLYVEYVSLQTALHNWHQTGQDLSMLGRSKQLWLNCNAQLMHAVV